MSVQSIFSQSQSFPAGDDVARMERAVRLLLNRLRRSERLATLPLSVAICNALGLKNPMIAVRKLIDDAFEGGGKEQLWLRDLIIKNDVENDVPRGEAARGENVSRRQFQRFHARGVAIIAAHISNLLGTESLDAASPSDRRLEALAELVAESAPGTVGEVCDLLSTDAPLNSQLLRLRALIDSGVEFADEEPLPEFGSLPKPLVYVSMAYAFQSNGNVDAAQRALERASAFSDDSKYDVPTRFEFERLAFLRARQSGRVREMVTIASNLRRLAAFPRSLAVASLAQAEAAICAGHVDQGEQLLDYVATINARRGNLAHTAIETMLRANVAFFRGNVNLADRLASGAYAVLRGRHLEARACAVLVARSRSASDLAWNPTDLAENLAPSSYDRLALEGERARHLLRAKATARAEKEARLVFETASALGHEGVAARAAATLASCLGIRTADAHQCERALRASLRGLLATGDWLLAIDLFDVPLPQRDFGPFEVNAALVDVIYDRIVMAVPQMTTDSSEAVFETRVFVREAIGGIFRKPGSPALLRAASNIQREGGALAQYFADARSDVERVLELAAFAAAPSLRSDLLVRIQAVTAPLAAAPAKIARTFSVNSRPDSSHLAGAQFATA